MRVFINAVIVHTFLNLYVFWRGWQVLPAKVVYRLPFILVFLIELLLYLTGFTMVDELPLEYLRPIMKVGTSWMVFILYMVVFLVVYDIASYVSRYSGRMARGFNFYSILYRRFYYGAAMLIVVFGMLWGSYRFHNPVVNEIDIQVAKTTSLDSLRIVMVADVHAGYLINREVVKMYVDKIMEQRPDVILMVGDIVDYDLYPLEYEQVGEEFRRLKAPYGIYGSTGNHEYRLNPEEKIQWLENKAGITMLRDTAVLVNDAFYLVGREDDKHLYRKELPEIMKDVDLKYPVIVMNHEPRRLYEESVAKADLAVYGHTHDGQLFPYNLLIHLIYELGHGYKKKDQTHMYVTSGLGLSGPQYRIGTISEIVVINMKFEK